jgi:DNA-binding response OmpR family regulator
MPKKASILIIDKEKLLVDLLLRALSTPELSVHGTTSVEEGTRLLELHGQDLVVVDTSLPNAIPLISNTQSASAAAKIVAVTASDEIRDRVRLMGIDATVSRDAGLDALVAAIRGLLPSPVAILGQDNRVGILIVDDEDELRTVVSEFMKDRGYVISMAKKGTEALERVQNDRSIQIVLLDVMMPVMGGMEVLRKIMATDPHPSVIMMTAVADREIARQALKIGAFDYILKPFDFAAIEASVTACLSHSEYQKQPWWKRLTRG